MKQKFTLLICLIFLMATVGLFAEEDPFGDGGEEAFFAVEEEIASVASKYAQKLSETPAILSVMTRPQLKDMGCRTLADALKYIPGIGISIDELGGYEKVAIRGVRQWPNVLFMIDGQRMNDFYTGLALYDFPVDDIEKIEIIRGPGSSIHGTGGFVGVINIKTNQKMPDGFIAKAEAGEYKSLRTSVNWKGEINEWKSNLFAQVFQTDGQRHLIYGQSDSTRAAEGRTQPHLPIDYIGPGDDTAAVAAENINRDSTALVPIIGRTLEDREKALIDYKLSKDNTNLKFKYMYDRRGPNIGLNGIKRPSTSLQRSIIAGIIDKSKEVNDNLTVISKFYFDQQMISDQNQTSNHTPVTNEVDDITISNRGDYQILDYTARTYGAEFQANYSFEAAGKHTLVSGIQFERLGLIDYIFTTQDANDIYTEFPQSNRSRTVMGIYLQDEYRPNDFIGVTVGARFDDYSDFGGTVNPKIGAVYLLGKHFDSEMIKGLGLKASFATAFRAPTFQELYDQTQADLIYGAVGTPTLEPETIETIEFAIEYEYKMIRLKANYFTNEITDQIGSYPGILSTNIGANNPYFNNKNKIESEGYEMEARTIKHTFIDFLPDMWLWTNVSVVETKAEAFDIGSLVHMDAVTRLELPKWEFSLGINSGISEYLRAAISYEKISERNSNTRTTGEMLTRLRWKIPEQEEYNIHVYTTPKLIEDYTIGLKVFNVSDEDNYDDPTTVSSQEVQRENKIVYGYVTVKF